MLKFDLSKIFDEVFIITIENEKNKGRWENVLEQLNKLGIEKYIKFPGVIVNNAESKDDRDLGCLLSHLQIIKRALQLNLKNVFIFEDDFLLDKRLESRLETYYHVLKSFINNENWDLLYLGGNHCGRLEDTNYKNILKIYKTKTTHSYAINSNCFEIVLNQWENYKNKKIPVDDFIIETVQSKKKSYCFYPRIFTQKKGNSFILNGYRNNEDELLEKEDYE